MKKTSKLISAFSAALFFALEFSSCDFLAGRKTASSESLASSGNYILVQSSSVSFDSGLAGKTAYLVKVNKGDKKVEAQNTGNIVSRNLSRSAESDSENDSKNNAEISAEIGFFKESSKTSSRCGFRIADISIPKGEILSESERSARAAERKISKYKEYSVGDKETFYAAVSETESGSGKMESKTATLKASGEHCNVWYIPPFSAKNYIDENKMNFDAFAKKFDSVYEKETQIFGKNEATRQYSNMIKISASDKINFLVYDLFGDAEENNTENGTYGYFDSTDLFLNSSSYASGYEQIYNSNEAQVLHIDSWMFQNNPESVYSTSAHEFQHLIQFVQKCINHNTEHTIWFQEMMSLVAEELLSETLGTQNDTSLFERLKYFDIRANYGFAEETWNQTSSDGQSGTYDYANSYAFGTYLMHNYGGIPLIHQIATNAYYEEEAITNALKTLGFTEANGNYEDFLTVLFKFPQVIANADGSDTSLKTLNKSVPADSVYGIGLNAIDLSVFSASDYGKSSDSVQYEIYRTQTKSLPLVYNTRSQLALYQYGMSVHHLGEIPEYQSPTIDISLPSSDNVVMYILVK